MKKQEGFATAKMEQIKSLLAKGMTIRECAEEMGIAKSTAHRLKQKLESTAAKTSRKPLVINVHVIDPLRFEVHDEKGQKFSFGLFTVLECLCLAQNMGIVPELPSDWWKAIGKRDNLNFHKE